MSNKDYNPEEMREAILDEVIRLYTEMEAATDWVEMPPHIRRITDEIHRLVTKAVGLTEG
jgi:hypothetical protein